MKQGRVTLIIGRRKNGDSMSIRRMIVIAGIIWLGWLQVPCRAEMIVLKLKPSKAVSYTHLTLPTSDLV